ncbi:MAG: DUF3987 domain-containing protein [Chloroflexi bacterium]|nr:DUF3987 domain-containing protein [Chloroflexota bacterium]
MEQDHYERDLNAWTADKSNLKGPKPNPLVMQHFFSMDSTIEATAQLRDESPGFALVRDELVSWVKPFDAYKSGRGGDRQNWLSLWAGAPIKVDRKGAAPISVPEPVIGVAGGIQPDLLIELANEAGRRDGFIERILWSYPDVLPERWTEATVSPSTKGAVAHLFRQLRRQPCDEPVRMDEQARTLWVSWYNENQQGTAQAKGLVQGIYAKLPNQAARLALILHCLKHPTDPADVALDMETMRGARELTEYFRSHAHRALTHFGVAAIAPSGGLALRMLPVLEGTAGEWLPRDDIHEGLGRSVPASEVSQALENLEGLGLAERRTVKPQGRGRPSEQWKRLYNEKNEEIPPWDRCAAEGCHEEVTAFDCERGLPWCAAHAPPE